MEFTETEIKMFREAKRFLPPWDPQEGDWFACINPISGKGNVYVYQDLYMGAEKNEACFPLYSQEQLQGMMLEPPNTLCPNIPEMLRLFMVFVAVNIRFNSMTQLWLAFVMHEKYQKVWNGETWVNEAGND